VESNGTSTNLGRGKNAYGFTLVDGRLAKDSAAKRADSAEARAVEFDKIRALFDTYKFTPFAPADPVDDTWIRAFSINAEVLTLLLDSQVSLSSQVSDSVIEKVLKNQALSNAQKVIELQVGLLNLIPNHWFC